MKINSSNSGTRGCGAGHSRVTLNLSVHKAYTKSVFMYFTTLQHVILIKWGSLFLGFFTQAKSLRTWHLVILEFPGRLQFWNMVALEPKWFLMVLHLILHIHSFFFVINNFFFSHTTQYTHSFLNLLQLTRVFSSPPVFSDPAVPVSILLSNGHVLTAISVLH